MDRYSIVIEVEVDCQPQACLWFQSIIDGDTAKAGANPQLKFLGAKLLGNNGRAILMAGPDAKCTVPARE